MGHMNVRVGIFYLFKQINLYVTSYECYSATTKHANNLLDRRERDLNVVRIADLTTLPTASIPKCHKNTCNCDRRTSCFICMNSLKVQFWNGNGQILLRIQCAFGTVLYKHMLLCALQR